MSELIQKNDNRATIRWKLLTGVSALALTAYVSSTSVAKAEDTARPQVWIELGGQWSHVSDKQELFVPDVFSSRPPSFPSIRKDENPLHYGFDEFGNISFQPNDSNWVFSASIRYGRSVRNRDNHQQSYPKPFVAVSPFGYGLTNKAYPNAEEFSDTAVRNSEQHAILDFAAGKDVGLGMFGSGEGTSVVSVGVRFAQFRSKSNIALKSDPDWHFRYQLITLTHYNSTNQTTKFAFNQKITQGQAYHSNRASLTARRNFHGVGPSISWKASVPIAGNTQDGAITLDWGLNAAMLFGRQRTRTHHQSTALYHGVHGPFGGAAVHHTNHYTFPDQTRSRSVTVPNVGAFAGLSYAFSDAKLSIGYRYDTFLSAMDTGIDATKKSNVTFNGPYASISFGLGD